MQVTNALAYSALAGGKSFMRLPPGLYFFPQNFPLREKTLALNITNPFFVATNAAAK
jgi:hypothetical protein